MCVSPKIFLSRFNKSYSEVHFLSTALLNLSVTFYLWKLSIVERERGIYIYIYGIPRGKWGSKSYKGKREGQKINFPWGRLKNPIYQILQIK